MEPALKPTEWEEALTWPHGVADYIIGPADGLGYGKNSPAHIHAVAALANAALPDDDPRKITREDLQAVMDANNAYENEFNQGDDRLYRLEAKLAALLPPTE